MPGEVSVVAHRALEPVWELKLACHGVHRDVRAVCANPRVRLGGEKEIERKKKEKKRIEKRKIREKKGKKKKRKFASFSVLFNFSVPFVKTELEIHFRPLSFSLLVFFLLLLIIIIIWLVGTGTLLWASQSSMAADPLCVVVL